MGPSKSHTVREGLCIYEEARKQLSLLSVWLKDSSDLLYIWVDLHFQLILHFGFNLGLRQPDDVVFA